MLEIPPFFRKCLRLCTGITKNQSLTDSGLTLVRMVWIRTTDHKVMSLNPETEDIWENIRTDFHRRKSIFSLSKSLIVVIFSMTQHEGFVSILVYY